MVRFLSWFELTNRDRRQYGLKGNFWSSSGYSRRLISGDDEKP